MYDFRMRAMNDKGYGMYTNIETFTTFAGELCVFIIIFLCVFKLQHNI